MYFEGKIVLPYIEELVLPWDSELLGSEVCWVPVASGQVPWSACAGNQCHSLIKYGQTGD